MTKNKNQKKKAAAAKNNNKNNDTGTLPEILTPPATPPTNNGVKAPVPPGTYANGMPRKPLVPWGKLYAI